MDELQRYVDILFADYRQFEAAEKLRLEMLNELLLQKETLQIAGQSEREAIRNVLASLDDFGAPAEGNILIYSRRYRHDTQLAQLLWLIAGLVLSVPLLVLGSPILSAVFAVAMLVAAMRFFRMDDAALETEAEFVDFDELRRGNRKLWLYWLIFTVIWLLGAYLWSAESFPIGSPVEIGGAYGKALLLARYYPPLPLAVIPLWGAGRSRLIWRNEVGAAQREEANERAL